MSGLSQKPGCDTEFQKGLTEEAMSDVKNHKFSESPMSVTKVKKYPQGVQKRDDDTQNYGDRAQEMTGAYASTTNPAVNTPMLPLWRRRTVQQKSEKRAAHRTPNTVHIEDTQSDRRRIRVGIICPH